MPTAKLCFRLGEMRLRQPGPHAQHRDGEEHEAAHEDGPQHLRPGGADRGEAEGHESVLAHVGGDGDRPVRIQAHQQRAEDRGHDRGHGARADRDAREREDRGVHHDDVGHRREGGDAAEHLAADAGAVSLQPEEPLQHRGDDSSRGAAGQKRWRKARRPAGLLPAGRRVDLAPAVARGRTPTSTSPPASSSRRATCRRPGRRPAGSPRSRPVDP